MLSRPFYDPEKTYDENYEHGPFGELADGRIVKRPGEPAIKFLGQTVFQPFGIPAGPLVNSRFCKAAFAKGYNLVVYKTVRTSEYPSHPAPNTVPLQIVGDLTPEKIAAGPVVRAQSYDEPLSITNSFGVPSKPVAVWQEDMTIAAQSAGKGQVLIGSFQGTKKGNGTAVDFVADYVHAARLVKETGAKILEANLSCPNEGSGDLVCFDVARVGEITEAIKNEVGNTPLILKIAFFENVTQLRQLIERVGSLVQGLSAINTIPAQIVDETGKQALLGEGRLVSGVCGAGIKWAGLEMVRRLTQLREKLGLSYAVIGVGGVMRPVDYHQYIEAKADAVMSATGAMWRPRLAEEIWQSQIKKGK